MATRKRTKAGSTLLVQGKSNLTIEERLASLRLNDWSVAVHNDYRLHGELWTFWLFTHPGGCWAKGEGRTDAEALDCVEKQINEIVG